MDSTGWPHAHMGRYYRSLNLPLALWGQQDRLRVRTLTAEELWPGGPATQG